MSANINEKTGIRYGVIQGNNCPILMEEIFSNGEDLTYKNWKEETIKAIAFSLADISGLGDYSLERRQKNLDEIAENTFEALADDGFFDNYESDENEYEYEDSSGNQFLLSYLGGAPLIWVIKSSRIGNPSRLCSPCVPNAGDLDSGFEDSPNGDTYGVPVEYLEEENIPCGKCGLTEKPLHTDGLCPDCHESSPESENLP